jgi:hypothetical protein
MASSYLRYNAGPGMLTAYWQRNQLWFQQKTRQLDLDRRNNRRNNSGISTEDERNEIFMLQCIS